MLHRVETTAKSVIDMYMKILTTRPNWMTACFGIDPHDICAFEKKMRNFNYRYEDDNTIVIVADRGHYCECHVAFLGKVNLFDLKDVVKELLVDHIRVEVPVTAESGHTLFRSLRDCGFQLEGTMRKKLHRKSIDGAHDLYLDVQMWSILRNEGEPNA